MKLVEKKDMSKSNIPITAVDQYDFLDHRRQQEKKHWSDKNGDPLDSILTIEVNTTELCNRTCVFCPRHDPSVFPNRQLHLTVKGAQTIAEELGDNNYQGKISFSGFGENLLNPNFIEIVKEFRFALPQATLECNTNGDKLDSIYANKLFRSGLDLLYINLYDGPEQMHHFDHIMKNANVREDQYKYRMHWGDFEKHGLILNNRSGTIDWVGIEEADIKSLQGTFAIILFTSCLWIGTETYCFAQMIGEENTLSGICYNRLYMMYGFQNP